VTGNALRVETLDEIGHCVCFRDRIPAKAVSGSASGVVNLGGRRFLYQLRSRMRADSMVEARGTLHLAERA
jgi:hypothetical protein